MRDSYNRTIRDLRISLTDRCNFRCFYCLPSGKPALARKDTILSFEEIFRISSIFVSLGIEKIRLTGGEPLIRRDVPLLVEKLATLKPRLKDIALTTNGYDFPRFAEELKRAGLDRVTLSLDSLQRERFADITGVDALDRALAAIDAAKEFGFEPVKVNAVIVRGRNDDELADFARFARERGITMRFIEFMPLDSEQNWTREAMVSGAEMRDRIADVFPLELKETKRGAGTSWRYTFADGAPGEIGIIAPVTDMFCGQCSRVRLTSDGQIRTCLFSEREHDLRSLIRSGAAEGEIVEFIERCVYQKELGHKINDPDFVQPTRTMSFIGG
ncbi:MAG: cyclic pyranopterin monophosphate synthase subunit MoaA [Acidobacteria bacterium OLB17]|nr:MAG: cyclic pyranopterin monophosphate synthase subunit MoaA [Acidobacteria bacterium OLB17]